MHAVHLDAEDITALGRRARTVCACPTTERNLGDGMVRADKLLAAGVRIAAGTDSDDQLAIPSRTCGELEYHLRLTELQRAVLDPA